MNFMTCSFWRSFGEASQLVPSDRDEIVLCGRSNVGKSTLINKLCNNNKLARVSSTPGKTTTINFFIVEDCYLVDLPGYGFSKRSDSDKERWGRLMESYFSSGRNIKLAVLLLDSRRSPNSDDMDMIHYFNAFDIKYIVVLTKIDKLNVKEYEKQYALVSSVLNDINCADIIPYSSLNNNSVIELRERINKNFAI